MEEVPMAIADSRYLWAEVDRLKSQVQELRVASRLTQEDRARTAELLASFVTRAQLDAALSTKVSLAHVDAQMDTIRSEMAGHLDRKADLSSLVTLQATKLDVSVFDANAWDLQKLRVAMEQHVRDLFATFAGQLENQLSTKLAIEDFNRVFNPEATGQKASLESAALRISKMTNQLESLSSYMNGDRQRQRQVAELNVSMLDLTRKQTATRNSIVQLESAEQTTTAQLRALNDQTALAMANLQSLSETLCGLQEQSQADKSTIDARQARVVHNVKQLEEQSQQLAKNLTELQQFAHSGLVDTVDLKLKTNWEQLKDETSKVGATLGQQTQQLNQRVNKANDLLLHHTEHLAQLDASIRKLAGLLKETQGDLNHVKGPLATLATNLHEENVAIIQEIERSQNGTRNIMLDYQDLLEREKSSQISVPLPSRPSSSPSCSSDVTPSRKHKQQMLLATKVANRPHTSSARIRVSSSSNGLNVRRSAGAVRSRSPLIPWRAQTAGVMPQVAIFADACNSINSPRQPSLGHKNVSKSIFQSDEDLFHFPHPEPSQTNS